jgi:peptidoglycan/LPS O-acetylase OafA/YrhL
MHRDPQPAAPRNFGLDAVRAVAITMVLVAHNAFFIGGWIGDPCPIRVSLAGPFGVELFFGLSGFLIGGLLLDIARTAPSLANLGIFLVRRWLRTLPLYFLWLAVLLVCWPPVKLYWWHVLHYATLTQNLTHGMPPGDFFAVSWSLTIEEWFYLLFSVVGLGGVILTRSRMAFVVAIGLFLVVPAWLRWLVPSDLDYGNSIEKVALLNLDSVARGVAMAAILRGWRLRWWFAVPLAVVGMGFVLVVWTGHWQVSGPVFRTFLTTMVGTGWLLCLPLLLLWRRCDNLAGRMVRALSRISYGLYIVHYTILEHARDFLPVPLAIVAGVVVPFVIAALSWRYMEAPILAWRPRQAGLAPARPGALDRA